MAKEVDGIFYPLTLHALGYDARCHCPANTSMLRSTSNVTKFNLGLRRLTLHMSIGVSPTYIPTSKIVD